MMKAILQYAFEEIGLLSVQLNVFDANVGARKCYVNAGFEEKMMTKSVFSYKEECWGRCLMEYSIRWKLLAALTDKNVLGLDGLSTKAPRRTARGIVENSEGLYAVMYAKKFDLYTLPGGGVEEGEDLIETLKREMLEETGCICDQIAPIGYVSENRFHADYVVESYYFAVKTNTKNGQLHLTAGELENGTSVKWCTLQEMFHLIKDREHDTNQRRFLQARDTAALKAYAKILNKDN